MGFHDAFLTALGSFTSEKRIDRSMKFVFVVAAAAKEWEHGEYKVLDFTFNYLPHSDANYSNEIFDGAIVVTNKRLFVFDLETSNKRVFNVSDVKAEIHNTQNLFARGVVNKFSVSAEYDPYFTISSDTEQILSFWIMDRRPNRTVIILPRFAADNRYYGLFLVLQSLKNNYLELTKATDIFDYRRQGSGHVVVMLPFLLFAGMSIVGAIASLITGTTRYFPIALAIGMGIAMISLMIGIPFVILNKKMFDATLRRQALETFRM
jgi:hypothetical protein